MRTTEQRLRNVVVDSLGIAEDEVSRDSNFADDFGADSIDLAYFVQDIEKEFCISIPDSDAEKISTFGEAVDYINQLLKR